MHHTPDAIEKIGRLRQHLKWACVGGAIFSTVFFFQSLGEAFLAGASEPSTPSAIPFAAIYLWLIVIVFRLAKALDSRVYYSWIITALMLFPVANLFVIISLFINSGQALAGPKLYK
jgi:hypothetical protein